MPTNTKQRIDQILTSAQLAISNALANEPIRSTLAEYGYPEARLNAGMDLCIAARSAYEQQKIAYGEQTAASTALNDAWEQASATYMRQVKLARVALKDEAGVGLMLGLDGNRKQSFSGWLAQARQFYAGLAAKPALASKLVEYGITSAKLQEARAALDELETLNQAQETERGEAQAVTVARDQAIDDLGEWMADFRKVARVALDDNPQLLEELGILARSA